MHWKKPTNPSVPAGSASLGHQLLNRLLGAASQTNKLLCDIRDSFDGQRGPGPVEASLTSVVMSGKIPQKIAGSNPDRIGLWICNNGDADLMIGPQAVDVSRTLFSAIITPGDTMRMPLRDSRLYRQAIYGVWAATASAGSTAMVTEYFQTEQQSMPPAP